MYRRKSSTPINSLCFTEWQWLTMLAMLAKEIHISHCYFWYSTRYQNHTHIIMLIFETLFHFICCVLCARCSRPVLFSCCCSAVCTLVRHFLCLVCVHCIFPGWRFKHDTLAEPIEKWQKRWMCPQKMRSHTHKPLFILFGVTLSSSTWGTSFQGAPLPFAIHLLLWCAPDAIELSFILAHASVCIHAMYYS